MLLIQGAIQHGVERIRLHVLAGEPCGAMQWAAGAGAASQPPERMRSAAALRCCPLPTCFPCCAPADGRDVNDDTAVPWIERLHGDAGKLSEQRGVDVSAGACCLL